jgi:hypothetical protein
MMTKPKYHHIIPQFILRHFTCSPIGTKAKNQEIFTYDIDKETVRSGKINKTGGETHFYSVTQENGERNTVLEEGLSKLEGPASSLWEKLKNNQILSKQEKNDLSLFFPILMFKTRWCLRQREEILIQDAVFFAKNNDDYFSHFIREREKEENRIFTDQDRHDILRPNENIEIRINQEFLLPYAFNWELIEMTSRIIYNMNWTLIYAPENKVFITSDNPIVILHNGLGLIDPNLEISLPLSPNCCLLVHRNNSLSENINLSIERLNMFNDLRALYAERFLFSSQNESSISELAKKYKNKKITLFKVS